MFRKAVFFIWLAGVLNSCVFFGPSKNELFSVAVRKQPYDVIIVPGIPHDTISDRWDLALKGRIYWAKFLYDKGMTKNIIFSGGAVYTPYIESEIMARYATSLGIPKKHIFTETKAEHSTENIYYSYYLAKRLGFQKIAVATDPFQAKLLRRYPKKMKMKLDFIPFVIDSLKTIDKSGFVKLSAQERKVPNFVSIADRQSRFKRFLGTLGKNITIDEADERRKKKKQRKENLDVRAF
ncbi:MAG TPA: YdcF family protein [Cytophagaceae bacterium]|jgi:uncharacterized SAM-binding protein YcdF (DUF218 family)|nr:YdcF family protein [Cytophagaceae bacterium]